MHTPLPVSFHRVFLRDPISVFVLSAQIILLQSYWRTVLCNSGVPQTQRSAFVIFNIVIWEVLDTWNTFETWKLFTWFIDVMFSSDRHVLYCNWNLCFVHAASNLMLELNNSCLSYLNSQWRTITTIVFNARFSQSCVNLLSSNNPRLCQHCFLMVDGIYPPKFKWAWYQV